MTENNENQKDLLIFLGESPASTIAELPADELEELLSAVLDEYNKVKKKKIEKAFAKSITPEVLEIYMKELTMVEVLDNLLDFHGVERVMEVIQKWRLLHEVGFKI